MSTVAIEIEEGLKKRAEEILNQLGLSLSEAFNLLLHQVALRRSFPVELKVPDTFPVPCIDDLTDEEFDALMEEAFDDIEAGRTYTIEEVRKFMEEQYAKF